MAFPSDPLDVLVEMAIGEDPAADPSDWTWTDITEWVLVRDGIQITRGKSDRFTASSPSSLSLTVDNTGGRFVVRNPAGAYYPDLRRNVPIRVTAEDSVRFTGFADTLPVSWDVSGADPHVRLKAFGALKRLGRTRSSVLSAPRRYIPSTNPIIYWPLEDGPLAVSGVADVGTNRLVPWRGKHTSGAMVVTDTRWGQGSLGPWLPPAFQFPTIGGSNLAILVGRVDMPGSPTRWDVNFVFAASSGNEQLTLDINPGYLTGETGWPQLILDPPDGELRATFNAEPEVSAPVPGLFDGVGHSVRLSAVRSGDNVHWVAYVDGDVVLDELTDDPMTVPPIDSIGLVTSGSAGCVLGHVAVWATTVLSNTALASACLGWRDEPAGWRIERLCLDEFDVPFLATGGGDFLTQHIRLGDSQPMGPEPLGTFLAIARQAEETDGGILFEATTGELEYTTGRLRYNRDVDLALDYAQGHVAPPFEPTDDDSDIVNDVTATRAGGGGSAQFVDEAHVAAEGRYDVPITPNVFEDSQLADQASWRVHLGTVPELRYRELSLKLHGTPALLADWLACGIGSRVTIDNPPPELPPDVIDQNIVGYTETLTTFTWDVTANLAPASPFTVGVAEDDTLGRADTAGSELVDDVDAGTDTTMVVQTTDRPYWINSTDHSGEFPFDVRTGGTVLSVTGIAAPTSPTFQTGTAAHADNASVSPGLPASVLEGDVLFLLAAIRNSGTGRPNTPTGYTRLPVWESTENVQLFGKVAGSSESGPTVTFTAGVAGATTSARIVRFRGLAITDMGNAVVAAQTVLNESAQDIAYPSLFVPARALVFYIGWKQDDWTSVAALAGTSEVFDDFSTTGSDQGIVMDRLILAGTGDYIPPGSFTVTGGAAAISRGAVVALLDDTQTFTVTQTPVNGVTGTVIAGSSVALANPMIAGL